MSPENNWAIGAIMHSDTGVNQSTYDQLYDNNSLESSAPFHGGILQVIVYIFPILSIVLRGWNIILTRYIGRSFYWAGR